MPSNPRADGETPDAQGLTRQQRLLLVRTINRAARGEPLDAPERELLTLLADQMNSETLRNWIGRPGPHEFKSHAQE